MPSPLQTALTRLDLLGGISDDSAALTRTFLSPANRQAASQLLEWMNALGMETCHTPDGSIRGILPGSNPGAPPLLLGSHFDTVIDAGKYDGTLGLLTALAALETIAADGLTLPYPVHLLGFSDEEGVRFQTTYLGSGSMVGPLPPETLTRHDRKGTTVAEAIDKEGWQENATSICYPPHTTRGYLELHIEQGRILEEANEAAAIVSGIAGQTRLLLTVTGRADHAGTTPMALRRDALTGAAECILAVEALALQNKPLLATVGELNLHPGASNSIPQTTTFTVDFRHPEDTCRQELLQNLKKTCLALSSARALELTWTVVQENNAIPCDPALTEQLLSSLNHTTGHRRLIASGAGHDGVALSRVTPIGMIFLRCRDGLSHHPDEYTSPEDIATGIQILTHFLKSLPAN